MCGVYAHHIVWGEGVKKTNPLIPRPLAPMCSVYAHHNKLGRRGVKNHLHSVAYWRGQGEVAVTPENFEIEPLSNWSLGEGWTRAQTENGFALQSSQML
jgi:hypothetical protein